MSRGFFLDCAFCNEAIFSYGELNEYGEYRTVKTDRGNLLVCKPPPPASVKKMWKRVPCLMRNKDGSDCKSEANNINPYHCARHGGGKK